MPPKTHRPWRMVRIAAKVSEYGSGIYNEITVGGKNVEKTEDEAQP